MAVFECVEDVDSYIQNKELVQGAKFVQRNVTQSYASPGNIYCKWFSHSGTLAWNFGFVFAHCMSCRRNRTLDFRLANGQWWCVTACLSVLSCKHKIMLVAILSGFDNNKFLTTELQIIKIHYPLPPNSTIQRHKCHTTTTSGSTIEVR